MDLVDGDINVLSLKAKEKDRDSELLSNGEILRLLSRRVYSARPIFCVMNHGRSFHSPANILKVRRGSQTLALRHVLR